ncbi:MAG: cytochrome P450, partial [Bacteroidetes bacterium]|nr:cytochrome P450 [Bacteroidota bacterium]
IPERFSVEKKKILPRAAFIPFGLGKRQCIGLNMAMIEGPLILEMLAKQFQLSLVDEAEEVKLDATFALHPLREMRMNIEVI